MDNENISYDEFAEAFDDTADYQTDGVEESEAEVQTEVSEETQAEAQAAGSEASEGNDDGNQTEDDSKANAEDQAEQPGETFTLKVNKEEKTYSREEVISLAQKGADYDRVKDQLTQSRQNAESLQKQLDEQKDAMDALQEFAKGFGKDVPALVREMRINLLQKQGLSEDAAKERLARLDAERENAALKAAAEEVQSQETGQQRAQRELAEFRAAYPEVELTQELLGELMADVQGGTPLIRAYQKNEAAKKDAQIAELQRQLAAEKQNKANLAASPGSQKDSGGKRTKSDYDEFMAAFE